MAPLPARRRERRPPARPVERLRFPACGHGHLRRRPRGPRAVARRRRSTAPSDAEPGTRARALVGPDRRRRRRGLAVRRRQRFDRDRQRDTDDGLAAARHWLGVRRSYTEVGRYDELPPGRGRAVRTPPRLRRRHGRRPARRRPPPPRRPRTTGGRGATTEAAGARSRATTRPGASAGAMGPGGPCVTGLLWTATLADPRSSCWLRGAPTSARPRGLRPIDRPGRRSGQRPAVRRVTSPTASPLGSHGGHRRRPDRHRHQRHRAAAASASCEACSTPGGRRWSSARSCGGATWPRQRGTESVRGPLDRRRRRHRPSASAPSSRERASRRSSSQDDEVELGVTPVPRVRALRAVTSQRPRRAPAAVPLDQLTGPALATPRALDRAPRLRQRDTGSGNGHALLPGTGTGSVGPRPCPAAAALFAAGVDDVVTNEMTPREHRLPTKASRCRPKRSGGRRRRFSAPRAARRSARR